MAVILVALGGMAGAISRFLVQKIVQNKKMPTSTLIVNLLGSFLLGLIAGQGIHGDFYLLAATGFMGAFTTFSTLNVDLIKLIHAKQKKAAFNYFMITYAGGLLCMVFGLLTGRII